MKKSWFLSLSVVILAAAVVLAGFGLWRYGGTRNLWRRARAEVTAHQPHPEFVPTPLPVPRATTTERLTPVQPTPTESPSPQPIMMSAEKASRTATPARVTASPPPRPNTHTPTPTPTSTPSPTPLPPSVRLTGLTHMWQTWNNCGPATLAMNLSYFERRIPQADIAAALRPYEDDKNVSPEELAAYARSQGLHALVRSNGNAEKLRQFLSAGVPVLIETWYEPKPNDGMGHYRLLTGYDDAAGQWIAYDSYDATGTVKGQPYAGIRLPYAGLDALWGVFNRQYVVIYDDTRAPAAERIVGDDLDDAVMWARALAGAEASVKQQPDDPFAWFNLGTDAVALGRFGEAADGYDRARRIGLPWRMLWYQFGPFRAYYETGRYDEVIALADATIGTAKHVEELFFWRGQAQNALGQREGARTSWQRALELNPNYADARAALASTDE